ncbi:hypothetical protein [Mycobacterium uberis]|uniref:hypothetical protein n=1 Tax=Mycobacterium uberis TaxID=2162698 RepID=UPI000E30127D|nr:hypothetical protein [Mycobacterium uberis]
MEIATIIRYLLPVTLVILKNVNVYRGDEIPVSTPRTTAAPKVLNASVPRLDSKNPQKQRTSHLNTL